MTAKFIGSMNIAKYTGPNLNKQYDMNHKYKTLVKEFGDVYKMTSNDYIVWIYIQYYGLYKVQL